MDHVARNVFVATDEPSVLTALQKEHPRYNWIGRQVFHAGPHIGVIRRTVGQN